MKPLIIFFVGFLLFSCSSREEIDNITIIEIVDSYEIFAEDMLCTLCGVIINEKTQGETHIDNPKPIFTYFVTCKPFFEQNEHIEDRFRATSNDRFYISGIPDQFIGVYLPLNFIEFLAETRNFSLAMNQNWVGGRSYHDILIVDNFRNRIWSNAGFHDGYAIPAIEAKYFEFISTYRLIDNSQQMMIIDNNGFKYIKIFCTKNIYDMTELMINSFDAVSCFVGRIIFADAIERNKIELRGDIVYIIELNREFRILLSTFTIGNPNLMVVGDRELLFLEIIDGRYIFYNTIPYCAMSSQRGENIVFEF